MVDPRILFLEKVTSTQDAAIDHDLHVGDVCYSFNQTAGRGRRGNTWDSTGGVAVTVVLDCATPHLPIAIAVTLAAALNEVNPNHRVGIKWPNDLFVDGKKLAGILIEQRENRCLVGVGVNVQEAPIPTATALSQLGSTSTQEEIATLVARSVFDATQLGETEAVSAWSERDILIGTIQTVQSGDRTVEGMVLSINPCHNLILQNSSGILELPAAISTIVTPCKQTR